MKEDEKTRKRRNPRVAIGDEQPLLQVLVYQATRRGETLAALARQLGVTYERLAQWRRGEGLIGNANRDVLDAAAKYLGCPTVLVLAMSGTIGILDFVWPGQTSLDMRVAQDLERLRQDPFIGGFVPAELATAAPTVKLFVTFMFHQLTGDAGHEKRNYQWIHAMHLAAAGNVDAQADLEVHRRAAAQTSSIF